MNKPYAVSFHTLFLSFPFQSRLLGWDQLRLGFLQRRGHSTEVPANSGVKRQTWDRKTRKLEKDGGDLALYPSPAMPATQPL